MQESVLNTHSTEVSELWGGSSENVTLNKAQLLESQILNEYVLKRCQNEPRREKVPRL